MKKKTTHLKDGTVDNLIIQRHGKGFRSSTNDRGQGMMLLTPKSVNDTR